MLSHESMMSYYKINNYLLFRKKDSHAFEQNIKLTELEEMLPYERQIYILLMGNTIAENEKQGST